MTRNLYALLVGIDKYVTVSELKGCVNDIRAVEAYLEGRVATDGYQLQLHTLLNEEATRQSIIEGFRYHLSQADSEDVALFYFAGHGGQQDSPEAFWQLEPDRMDEVLVCYDSFSTGGWGLADKELATLIAEVDKKNPHIAIILDCCHSGSGTRGDLDGDTAVRKTPTDRRKRPLDSFIFSLADIEHLPAASPNPEVNPSGWTLPKGKHIVLSACRDSELAKEYNGKGQYRGAFSYFLLDTLEKANGSLTYRDLFKRTNALVRSKLTDQSPQIEATNLKDLDQPFLGGAIASSTPYFTVSHHKDHGWAIDGGAVHGIPQPTQGQTTLLALFPFDSPPEQLRQLSEANGSAEVIKLLPQLSTVQINGIENLNTETTYKAVITSLPLPPKGILMTGDTEGIELARAALQKIGAGQQPSLYVAEVTTVEAAEFKLLARDGQYLISRPADERPLVAQIQGYSAASAMQAIQRLEHMARWTNIAELSNPAKSRIQAGAVQMSLFQEGRELQEAQIRLEYQQENGKWKRPSFKVKLKNTSNEPLYCALLDLTDRYAVRAGELLPGGVWLDKGQETWAFQGKEIPATVPKELWEQGITETKDLLKLIVSTDEFDASLLEQENLDLPSSRDAREAGRGQGTLNRLMRRVQSRELGADPEEEELYDDWISTEVSITIVRPLNATVVPNDITGEGISLGSGVTLQPHSGLKAQARLTTLTQSTRDLGSRILPLILREDSTVTQPFQFTTSRGSDPGLSALELSHVDAETITTVTPQNPLKLSVDTTLGEGERVLAIAHDGEFFLPLGLGQTKEGKTEITLERLPDPVSQGERSLTGAIRIFFQKVVSEKLGLEFPYPILAAVNVSPDGTVDYDGEQKNVKERVATARRIVLYIHGIIGDTKSMVPSVRSAQITVNGQQELLGDQYDLVLSFDYESLNTSIENHARSLKQRLAEVGLDRNHGKVLHIVAHSMGGLVARWFIEREGGNAIASHLIMLGTPNGGSPWPTVQAWGTAALALVLNSLTTVAWPVKVLGSLVAAIETIDTTLDQMQPDSEFLKSLAASPDPGMPYTILAGNTSIIPVVELTIKNLMQKLMMDAVALPFFKEPNDIAATVYSIKQVSEGRSPQPQVHEVACDHLVYFTNQEGLNALSIAISQALSQ